MSSINPYQTPLPVPTLEAPSAPLQTTRTGLQTLVLDYLNRNISAEQFASLIKPYSKSDDLVIQFLMTWYLDPEDLEVALEDRDDWNQIQRSLFCLVDDAVLVDRRSTVRPSRFGNLLATATLILSAASFFYYGPQWWIFLATGTVAAIICFTLPFRQTNPYDNIIQPFATFGDLERAYKRSSLRKTKFRNGHLICTDLTVGSKLLLGLMSLFMIILGFLISPIALLLFANPFSQTEKRIQIPA